ncbi:MAG: thiamine pyrophosphate-binding protein, partial [Chloroflexota bacterium]
MTTTAERKESPPYAMHGGRIIGRILKENGVKHVFGVEGGHIYPFETGFYEFGIKRLHMRHEQAGAYAADAYARCTRSPGICYGTAGPGMTNMVSGINQAWLVRSPMVCLFGQHRRDLDHKRPFQEGYGVPVCDTMSKWGVFIEEWRLLPLYLRKALRECMIYPPGPVVLAMEPRALYIPADEKTLVGDVPNSAKAAPSVGGAKTEDVERAVRMLIQAERPALVGGDGIYWADAGPELLELAERLNIPVNTRRMGRGAVPEDHPLAIHAGWRLSFWPKADTILLAGLKINSDLENNGEPPTWPAQAKRIYLHESIMDAWAPVPMEMEIIANPKVALRQMIDCARSLVKRPPQRKAWLEHLARVRENYDAGKKASSEEVRGNVPIHGFHVAQEIVDFLDPSATVIFDAYSGTAHLTARLKAKFAGQVLDSGECGGVGHGIGMGIGAQVARPGKQVLVMMGDAG